MKEVRFGKVLVFCYFYFPHKLVFSSHPKLLQQYKKKQKNLVVWHVSHAQVTGVKLAKEV